MTLAAENLFTSVVGQPLAVNQLQAALINPVHAYLFVGPPGTGKRAAARAFAAGILSHSKEEIDLVQREVHPDFVVVERAGASIAVDQAREIIRLANRTPSEGDRKVMLLTDFHLVDKAGPALLKTIEEPPASTTFIILAEHVTPELVTIASRCVQIEFAPLSEAVVIEQLMAEGADGVQAEAAALASSGQLDRARQLLADPQVDARRRYWASIPEQLDGRGHTVVTIAGEIASYLDQAIEPVVSRQQTEQAELVERAKSYGEKGPTKKDTEDRFKREQRRVRTDELRFGLATLATAYRDRLTNEQNSRRARQCLDAIEIIQDANEMLIRNPNESLFLLGLLTRLSQLTS